MKISRRYYVLTLAPLALAVSVSANDRQDAATLQDEADSAVPSAAAEGDIVVEGEPDPTVCKRFAPPTSSKISRKKKICKLQSEWAYERRQLDAQNRAAMDNQFGNTSIEVSKAFQRSSGRDLVSPQSPQ